MMEKSLHTPFSSRTRLLPLMLCFGLLGCLCFGGGDWLMMYGDPTYAGNLKWLTEGVAQIPQWRYHLAMALAFPGILFYGVALFSMEQLIIDSRRKTIYHYLNAFGLTPWLMLHLFYLMILTLFSWLSQNGFAADALAICEALASAFLWIAPVSELMMLPVFVYWFYLQIRSFTICPRWMAFANVLFFYLILKIISMCIPKCDAQLAFINGLMSESMFPMFLILLIYLCFPHKQISSADR